MLTKIIKLLLLIMISALILLAIIIKQPNTILNYLNQITEYTIDFKNINIDIKRKLIIINELDIKKENNHYSFDSLSIDSYLNININKANLLIKDNQNNNKFNFYAINKININELNLTYKDISLNASLRLEGNKLDARIKQFVYSSKILKYITNKEANNYIDTAIKNLTAKDIILELDLATLEFNANGIIDNLILAPYKKWQVIDSKNINFNLNNKNLELNINSAYMGNLSIRDAIVIVDWDKKQSVSVLINQPSSSQDAMTFLKNSPIRNNIEKVIENVIPFGDAYAEIYMEFYFDEKKKQIIDINVDLENNRVRIFDKILINNFKGELVFNNEVYNNLEIIGDGDFKEDGIDVNLRYSEELNANITYKDTLFKLSNKNQDWFIDMLNNSLLLRAGIDFTTEIPTINITKANIDKNQNNNKFNIGINDINSFKLTTDNVRIDGSLMPNIVASFNKINSKQININNLYIKDSQEPLIWNGLWRDNKTRISTKITNKNIDKIANDLNIKQKTGGGMIDADIILNCDCDPWQIKANKLNGKAKVIVRNGEMNNNNFFGKLLSILNIRSLQKMLKAESNFSTINNLKYDEIQTSLNMTNGIANIYNFNLKSEIANIDIKGSSDIVNKTHNLNAVVTPKVADSLPIIVYLGGMGAIGVGTWLVDKFIFDKKLINSVTKDILKFEYQITGPWSNPNIN